jgi:hypothetical protein
MPSADKRGENPGLGGNCTDLGPQADSRDMKENHLHRALEPPNVHGWPVIMAPTLPWHRHKIILLGRGISLSDVL